MVPRMTCSRNPVRQKHQLGCGVACVAFLNGEKYDAVANRMGVTAANQKGFRLRELTKYLRVSNSKYLPHHPTTVEDRILREGTIVFIDRSNTYPYGHYLVRTADGWMDPWINYHEGAQVQLSKAGIRKRLPGRVKWAITDDAIK